MRRADRLFEIVQLMRGGRLTTAAQLADRLEVSKRTIYRDVADLMASGVPITGEAGTGYVMGAGFDLPPLMFSESEIIALVAGARMIEVWGGKQMGLNATEAIVKIASVLPDHLKSRIDSVQVNTVDMNDLTDDTRRHVDTVEQAAHLRQSLTMAYRDEQGAVSNRTVRPLGVWYWGKVWTMVCWCELRNDFRMFRLDRVVDLQVGEVFRDERGKTLRDFFQSDRIKNDPRPPKGKSAPKGARS